MVVTSLATDGAAHVGFGSSRGAVKSYQSSASASKFLLSLSISLAGAKALVHVYAVRGGVRTPLVTFCPSERWCVNWFLSGACGGQRLRPPPYALVQKVMRAVNPR